MQKDDRHLAKQEQGTENILPQRSYQVIRKPPASKHTGHDSLHTRSTITPRLQENQDTGSTP